MGLTSSSWCLAYEPAPWFLGSWIRTQLIRMKRLAGTEGVFWALCAGSVHLLPWRQKRAIKGHCLGDQMLLLLTSQCLTQSWLYLCNILWGFLLTTRGQQQVAPSVLSKREGSGSGASKHGFKNKRTGKVSSHILMNCQDGLPNLFSFSVSLSLLSN